MGLVAESLELVKADLPRLAPAALERLAAIVARVPDGAKSHYVELRLNAGEQVDFLTFWGSKNIAERLARSLGSEPSPVWRRNLELLAEWTSPDGSLKEVPFFSLEYDAGDRFVAGEPEASLSPGIDSRHIQRHSGVLFGETPETTALGKRAFQRLLPSSAREACMRVIDRLYAALPPQGAIPHAPVMTAREPVVAKPYVILPRDSLFEFLEKIEWPGSRSALERLLATYYAAFTHSVYIDLTVTDHVHSRLGLVTSQFQREEADFSNLEWWGLPPSLKQYKRQLAAWPGWRESHLAGTRVWMQRWLDTKAVLHDTEIEYKAYLGFSPATPPLLC